MQYRYSLMDDDTTSRHLPVTSIRFLNTGEIQAEHRLMATCKFTTFVPNDKEKADI